MISRQRRADALCFDFGGVLAQIDFNLAFQSWARTANVPARSLAERFSFDPVYQAHERGETSTAQYFTALRGSLGVSLSDAQLLAGWNAIFLDPMPGIAELLPRLATVAPLYVFSNTNHEHHVCWREKYRDLLAPITEVYCSHEIGARKPGEQAFAAVAQRIGCPPDRIAFFDDLADNVAGSRKVGFLGFQVTSTPMLKRALAEDLNIDVAL